MKIPRVFFFVMKYVAPAYLLIVLGGYLFWPESETGLSSFAAALKRTSGDPVAFWTLLIIVAVLVLLIGILMIGERRWRAAGLDLDGNTPPQRPGDSQP